jgi:cell wall-associated NlpC family hydrolase
MLGSCSETGEKSLVSEVKESVDSLQKDYAPDTRVVLWRISVKSGQNKETVVRGEVESDEAQKALQNLKKRFPSVRVEVSLLPERQWKNKIALINNSVSSIRRKTTRASEMLNQALLGTPLKVFQKKGEWYLIQTPDRYLGWINQADIVLFTQKDLQRYENHPKMVYNRQYGFSYSRPDSHSLVVSDLAVGCVLPVTAVKGDFYQVKYPDGRTAFVKKEEAVNFDDFIHRKPTPESLVKTALKFNGIPYLWGGRSSKAIDCSGFSSTIYYLNGILLQRDASQQTRYGKEITTRFDFRKLQPGDLLFFGRKAKGNQPEKVTHVAMYIGKGRFIHSSGKVRISNMDPASPEYAGEYAPRFVRAVRIIGQVNGTTIQRLADNPFYQMLKTK